MDSAEEMAELASESWTESARTTVRRARWSGVQAAGETAETLTESKMLRAWIRGALVVAIAQAIWFGTFVLDRYIALAMVMFWSAPLFAGGAAAYLSPKRPLAIGASMALVAGALTVVWNTAFQLLGKPIDFSGASGGWTLFLVTIAYSLVLALLGSAVGRWLRIKHVDQSATSAM
jgi:hypothetical protein